MSGKYIHYVLSPLFYLAVATLGGYFTSLGVTSWYPTLAKPVFTPPGSLIATIWTIIYALSAISYILFVKAERGLKPFWFITCVYIFNGVINALWSFIFFTRHMLFVAVVDAFFILVTVILMMFFVWRYSVISALLLLPYLLWVSFATFLSFMIYRLN